MSRTPTACSCVMALFVSAACSNSSPHPPDAVLPDAAPYIPVGTDAGDGDGGSEVQIRVPLTIRFDYRYDTHGFFADPKRRKVLDEAATYWTSRLKDRFLRAARGTPFVIVQPETYESVHLTLEADSDGILVFAASGPLMQRVGGMGGPAGVFENALDGLTKRALARYLSDDFEPFAGSLTFSNLPMFYFDETPESNDDVPNDQEDFLSVAIHELGHILGFGTAPRFDRLVATGAFAGSHVQALLGGPAPLSPDGKHLSDALTSGGGRPCLSASLLLGRRCTATPLDLAALADLGYEL